MDEKAPGVAAQSTANSHVVVTDAGSAQLVGQNEYPDGGLQAWTTLFGCFCAFFSSLSLLNSIGVYQSYVSEHQLRSVDVGKIGWIFGFSNFFMFFGGIFVGPFFDLKGPRILCATGGVLLILAYLLLAQCKAYWHFFLCFGFLGSGAASITFTAALGTIQHWFLKRRGLATGIAISGGSMGGIVCPLVLRELLSKIGWTWSMRVLALIMSPFAVASILLVRARLEQSSTSSWKSMIPDLTILLHWQNSVLAIGCLLMDMGLFMPMTYIASYAVAQGASTESAYTLVTLMSVGSLMGRWLSGWFGDKIGHFNAQICAFILCLMSDFFIWQTAGKSMAQAIGFVVVFGIASGSCISLVPVCIAQICNVQEYGRHVTTIYSLASIGALVGIPIGGELLRIQGGKYEGVILLSGSAYAVALISFTSVRVACAGYRIGTKF